MIKGKLRVIEGGSVAFWCPGCKEWHAVHVEGSVHPVWSFNGNYNNPTFSPSVLVRSGHYTGKEDIKNCWCTYYKEHPEEEVHFKCGICHSFVIKGKIQYLGDCTHELAGQTVDMVLPDLS
jgi:hypothetical protein